MEKKKSKSDSSLPVAEEQSSSPDATPICDSTDQTTNQRVSVAFYAGAGIQWRLGYAVGVHNHQGVGEPVVVCRMDDGTFCEKFSRDVRLVTDDGQ